MAGCEVIGEGGETIGAEEGEKLGEEGITEAEVILEEGVTFEVGGMDEVEEGTEEEVLLGAVIGMITSIIQVIRGTEM